MKRALALAVLLAFATACAEEAPPPPQAAAPAPSLPCYKRAAFEAQIKKALPHLDTFYDVDGPGEDFVRKAGALQGMGMVADRLAALVRDSVPRGADLLSQAADTFYRGAEASLTGDPQIAFQSMQAGTKQIGQARRVIDAAVAQQGLVDCPSIATSEDVPPPAGPEAHPALDYTKACDYVLGDFSEHSSTGYRFIAGADITNTGNVGIVVKVVAKWKQLGTDSVVESETVKVQYGKEKSVQITKPVGQNEIDLIQSAQGAGKICSVTAKIVDTFGEPRG